MRKKGSKKLLLTKEALRRLSPHQLSIPRGGDDTDDGCIDTMTCGTLDTLLMTAVLVQTVRCSVRQATCE